MKKAEKQRNKYRWRKKETRQIKLKETIKKFKENKSREEEGKEAQKRTKEVLKKWN